MVAHSYVRERAAMKFGAAQLLKTFPVAYTITNRHTANGILKQAGIDSKI